MKIYAVVVTLICLGLIIYILAGGTPDRSTVAASSAANVSQPYSSGKFANKPTEEPVIIYVRETLAPTVKPATYTYILNKSSKVFHKPTCSSVKKMKDSTKRT